MNIEPSRTNLLNRGRVHSSPGFARTALVVMVAIAALSESVSVTAQEEESGPAFRVVRHPELGNILVGRNGMTLYTFVKSDSGIDTCKDDCAINWPPLVTSAPAAAPPGLNQAEVTSVTRRRPDNRRQVSYRGQLLHFWFGDKVPGDVTGQGIGDRWFVARPGAGPPN